MIDQCKNPTSRGVTLIAVTLVVLSGLATVIGLLPTVAYTFRLRRGEGDAFLAMVQVAFLLFDVLVLALAIGLLKRRNWARLGLVGVMSSVIVWEVAARILKLVDGTSIVPRNPVAAVSLAVLALLLVSTVHLLQPSVRGEFSCVRTDDRQSTTA